MEWEGAERRGKLSMFFRAKVTPLPPPPPPPIDDVLLATLVVLACFTLYLLLTRRTEPSAPTLEASCRARSVPSFKVMDVVQKADKLARSGRRIYHLEVGQPQSSAPRAAIERAREQLSSDRCGYTAARG